MTDQETLELAALCDALVDGTIKEKERKRLEAWLSESLEARRFYIRSMALSASLHAYAGEMQAGEPDRAPFAGPAMRTAAAAWRLPLAVAASVVVGLWVMLRPAPAPEPEAGAGESVARLTGARDCRWDRGGDPVDLGDHLTQNQRLDVASGLAEITFDSGAEVVLEGPAAIVLNSAWRATLLHGTLKASVPQEAIGFRVAHPRVEVVDLGTAFMMIADGSGAADVLVLRGVVEAEPDHEYGVESILLHENEARRFTHSGISAVQDDQLKIARYSMPVALDRFAPSPGLVHWGFDETRGGRFSAAALGGSEVAYPAVVRHLAPKFIDRVHVKGRRNGAIDFSGDGLARARFPGLSANAARTVAFWARIPADAQLSEAYAMGAWLPSGRGLRFRPIHICWNRNPEEGPMGALRTDYARGFAVGETSLRDGRWHHLAIVLTPSADDTGPMQVKLYVDGLFEGQGQPSPPGRRADSTKTAADYSDAVRDTLWLGCRLGSDGPRASRFRGSMDEFFVADRELTPAEIVQLMNRNSLSPIQLATDQAQERF